MTKWHHEIFRAMPRGRLVLASELHRAAKIPPGWSVKEVQAALLALAKRGAVEVERLNIGGSKAINGYRRIA